MNLEQLFAAIARWVILFISALLPANAMAADHSAANSTELRAALNAAKPSDTVILNNSEWRDADVDLNISGTSEAPINVRAESPAGVRFTGTSRMRISGSHLTVSGLWFDNCDPPKSDIISFRFDSKRLASNCTLSDCAITQDGETQDNTERRWLSLYGRGHTVERCHFTGKTSKGPMLVVWLPEQGGAPVEHVIRGSYFGERPRLGKNGGEIIRVGDSKTSMQNAGCLIEGNWFEHCDGEVECISNKSCDNIYRRNVFFECQGTLTLRHGNRCVVEANYFDGNNVKETGGIRVIGEDHRIIGNTMTRLTGDDARSALCLMNAERNPELNGYWPVRRAVIARNTIVDCKHGLLIGYADDDVDAPIAPANCRFIENQIHGPSTSALELLVKATDNEWTNNRFVGQSAGTLPSAGIDWSRFDPQPMSPPITRDATGATWSIPSLAARRVRD